MNAADPRLDRLYELLPAVYRARDAALGGPLRDLLSVIAEQVALVEHEIGQMYENWFIETADDWAVPYIGELVGYEPAHGSVPPTAGADLQRVLIPRRDVTNTIRARRRKGTLALLEELARDVAGWPARAVEFHRLLGWFQALNSRHARTGGTADLHSLELLERIGTAFDPLARSVDVRRIVSASPGFYNVPSVGLFVWRLQAIPVTQAPAACLEEINPAFYTFSVLGNDTPLFTRAVAEEDPIGIAGERNLPVPIRRRAMEKHLSEYYGEDRSVYLWVGRRSGRTVERRPVRLDQLVVADLSDWDAYLPRDGTVALDPVLGRLSFSRSMEPSGVWVSYLYGFSAAIGGGEYARVLHEPARPTSPPFRVVVSRRRGEVTTIEEALRRWNAVRDQQPHAIIELGDSEVYGEPLEIPLRRGETLHIRAAERTRPVIYLLDRERNRPDALSVYGDQQRPGGCLTLDGLLIAGRAVHLETLDGVTIRHCTLVPGWMLNENCSPKRPSEPSLELYRTRGRVRIESSILGSIEVFEDEVRQDPLPVEIVRSVVDATRSDFDAISAPNWPRAHAALTIRESTIIGKVSAHAIALGENSIFTGPLAIARRQIGCVRFSFVAPGSRTPRRFNCQPDKVEAAARQRATDEGWTATRLEREIDDERLRVRPSFGSLRYPDPTYVQLSQTCAVEITEGADDGGEMGALHHLHQTERLAALRARLAEYSPAGSDAAVILAT